MSEKKFVARKGSELNNEKAERYGNRITELKNENGTIDPAQLVEDAKNPESPLHDAFEWSDKKAAQKWRIHKARKIIASIEVELEQTDSAGKPQQVRAFYHVNTDEDRSYVDLDSVQCNKTYREQILEDALARLKRWKEKYEQYSEFKPVTKAISQVSKSLDIIIEKAE